MGGTEAKGGMRSLWEEGKASGKDRSRQGQGEDADGVPSWTLRTRAFQGGGALYRVSYRKGDQELRLAAGGGCSRQSSLGGVW